MMFCTSPDGKLTIPPIFDDKTECWWSYVRLPLFVPYFQVVCAGVSSEDECTQTLFLQSVAQLDMVLNDSDVEVLSVQLVSPGYINGKGIWQIDVLENIYRGIEVENGGHTQYAFVYVVSGGRRFLESSIAKTENDLSNLELLLDLTPIVDSMEDWLSESYAFSQS